MDKEEQMAKEQGRMVEAQHDMLKAAKKLYEARLTLRRQAFGESALFGPGCDVRFAAEQPAPGAPAAVEVIAYDGLLGVGGEAAWSRYVEGGYPSLAGLGGLHGASPGAFRARRYASTHCPLSGMSAHGSWQEQEQE